MSDFEKQFRADLRAAADGVDVPVSLESVAVGHRVAVARRRTLVSGIVAAVVLVVAVAGWNLVPRTTAVPVPPAATPTAAVPSPASPSATPSVVPYESVTPSSTPSTSTAPARTATVLVYCVDSFTGRTGRPPVSREPRAVNAMEPVEGALEAMIAGPVDPDSTSPWPAGTRVLGISNKDGVITVDLSAEARPLFRVDQVSLSAVQALVWTATEAYRLPSASVLIRIAGAPIGVAAMPDWDKPIPRAEKLGTLALVLIDSLAEGAIVSSPLTVTGEAAAFEAVVEYKVTRPDGTVAAKGTTKTSEGQTFAPYSLTLTLAPGSYVLQMSPSDPSDGEGGPVHGMTRSFTVR